MAFYRALSEVGHEPVSWLWDGFIPTRALSLLEGDPSIGKSTLITDIATKVSLGLPMPQCESATLPPSPVVLISSEMSPGTHRVNFEISGSDLTKVFILEHNGIRLPEDFHGFKRMIEEVSPKLVVIDPITDVLSVSINNDQAIRRVLNPVLQLANLHDFSVLGVRHLSKSATRALYAGAGSIALTALARSVLHVARHPGDPKQRVISISKSNIARQQSIAFQIQPTTRAVNPLSPSIQWLGAVDFTADQLIAHSDVTKRSALQEAEDFLYECLRDGPQSANKIATSAKEAGISTATLRRARQSLGVESRKQGIGAGQSFTLRLPRSGSSLEAAKNRFLEALCNRLVSDES